MSPNQTDRNRFRLLAIVLACVLPAGGSASAVPEIGFSKFGGAPRAWQDGVGPAPSVVVNMTHGNVMTAVPLVGWGGRGPSIGLALTHNSYATVSGLSAKSGAGFDLGEGWRIAYGGQVQVRIEGETYAYVIEDDGSTNRFTWNGSTWVAPPGIYDNLIDEGANGWKLVRKNQTWRRYQKMSDPLDPWSRLIEVGDASVGAGSNKITIAYVDDRISTITDASGRQLAFTCNAAGKLTGVSDPSGRQWSFEYFASGPNAGRLLYVNYPKPVSVPTRRLEFDYDSAGRIKQVGDFAGKKFGIAYDLKGAVSQVSDPAEIGSAHTFSFATYDGESEGENFMWDRRNKKWTWQITMPKSVIQRVTQRKNPLNETQDFEFNAQLQPTRYTDGRGQVWKFTHDANGNRTSLENPLGAVWRWGYDEAGHNAGSGTLNNLTSVRPPLNNAAGEDVNRRVDVYYLNAALPTSATRVVEPGPVETRVAYWFGDAPSGGAADRWNGLLKTVVDPRCVQTKFQYDNLGQPERMLEGAAADCGPPRSVPESVYPEYYGYDPVGRPESIASGEICGFCVNGDPLWVTSHGCYLAAHPCVIPGGGRAWPPNPHIAGGVPNYSVDQPAGVTQFTRDANGVVTIASGTLYNLPTFPTGGLFPTRSMRQDYDALYRLFLSETTFNDTRTGATITRTHTYVPDPDGRPLRRSIDGVETVFTYDDAGRARTVTKDGATATVFYDPAGRRERVEFGNGTQTRYAYNNANQLTGIFHERMTPYGLILGQTFEPDAAGRIVRIDEVDYSANQPGGGGPALFSATTFDYDNRNRLTHELRTGSNPYEYTYAYDASGNRTTKQRQDPITHVALDTTWYAYDVDDPDTYQTQNNRLMFYEVRTGSAPGGTLLKRVEYAYNDAGHVRYIVTTNDPQSNVRDAVALFYTKGSQLWLAVKERWQVVNGQIENRQRLAATEYLTDGVGIARWLVRRLDPGHDRQGNPTTSENPLDWALVSERLTDFAGAERDQDYAVPSGTTVSPTRRYFGGAGFTNLAAGQTFYVHSNPVGTNELATRADTSRATRNVYSAFGEPVFAASLAEGVSRYGYAGAFGYEGGDDANAPGYVEDVAAQAGLLHVGARYYDPSAGRFVMRDPIGIWGGLNVYAYVSAHPNQYIDPLGLAWYNPFGYEPIARGFIWVTGGEQSWLDDRPVVTELSRGFRNTGAAAYGCAVGMLAPGPSGFVTGGITTITHITGITTTGNTVIDEGLHSLSLGLTVGGMMPGKKPPRPDDGRVPWEAMSQPRKK